MAIREGRWDCTYCGTTGILGRSTTCTSCGRSRPEGVKFYLPENEEAVADQKLLALANKGADWICQYCGSSNRAGHTSCQHCASPREAERSENYVVQFVDAENKVYTQTLTFDEWLTYEEEESCQARVDLFDEIREIESCSQPALMEKN